MAQLFTTADGKAVIDIEIVPQTVQGTRGSTAKKPFKLSEKLSNDKTTKEAGAGQGPINVYAFRIVYTAGFALPLSQIVMSSNNKADLEQFKEGNNVKVTYGEIGGNKDTFLFQTVGSHIKTTPAKDVFVLTWGGVLIPSGTDSSMVKQTKVPKVGAVKLIPMAGNYVGLPFLQSNIVGKMSYDGPALQVLKEAWETLCGTSLKMDNIQETISSSRKYRVWKNLTPQNYLVDVFLHVDLRPSFPMAYIDKNFNLVLKDFQKLKAAGPTAILVPDKARVKFTKEQTAITNVVRYLGNPEPVSHRTYVTRGFGYSEISARDIQKGNYMKMSSDITDKEELDPTKPSAEDNIPDYSMSSSAIMQAISKAVPNKMFNFDFSSGGKGKNTNNTCSTAASASDKQTAPIRSLSDQVIINTNTPKAFHESCRYNVKNLANMSAVQLNVRVPEKYLNQIQVLDFVEVETGTPKDRAKGYWIVEAMEHGFFNGTVANVVYLCRDYLNDEENTSSAGAFSDAVWGCLGLPAKTKEQLVNMCQNSRTALTVCKGILNSRYLNEYQSYLINMKASSLANFNLFGTTINLNRAISTTTSLRNAGNSLLIKLIRSFFKDPFATLIISMLGSSFSLIAFILMLLSTILGPALYTALAMLIADLRNFDLFLKNYNNTLKSASQESKPDYVKNIIAGAITFEETPAGVLKETIVTPQPITRVPTVKPTQDEIISDIKKDITEDIIDRLPDGVDIPIIDTELNPDDIHKDREDIVDEIIDSVIKDLIDRGYIYNSSTPGMSTSDNGTASVDGVTKITSDKMNDILHGNDVFTAELVKVLRNTVGDSIKVRHWGTFDVYNDLSSFNINNSYADKYKTINATKSITCLGQKVFVALPTSETNVKFYINSERCTDLEEHTMDVADLGYTDGAGRAIPYTIYYTTESYDTVNLVLEMRKN